MSICSDPWDTAIASPYQGWRLRSAGMLHVPNPQERHERDKTTLVVVERSPGLQTKSKSSCTFRGSQCGRLGYRETSMHCCAISIGLEVYRAAQLPHSFSHTPNTHSGRAVGGTFSQLFLFNTDSPILNLESNLIIGTCQSDSSDGAS